MRTIFRFSSTSWSMRSVYIALARLPPYLARMLRASDELARINAEQFGHFIEQAPAAMAMFDREMRYIAVSARWREDFASRSRCRRQVALRGLPRDAGGMEGNPSPRAGRRERAMRTGPVRRGRTASGNGCAGRFAPGWSGRIASAACVIFAEDITDRMRIQEALQENERRLSAMFGAAMDAIVTTDRSGLILSANPAAQRDVRLRRRGTDRAQCRHADARKLRPATTIPTSRPMSTTGVRKIIGQRRTVEGLRKNGEVFPLELTVSEARVADGSVFVGVMRDLSPIEAERRRVNALRDELAHVSRLNDMGEMVAGLAHEVAQPVAAISEFFGRLSPRLGDDGQGAGSRPDRQDRGSGAPRRRNPQAPARLHRKAPARAPRGRNREPDRRRAQTADLALAAPAAAPDWPDSELAGARICVDPIQIEQVLVNLLRNADDALIDTAAPEIVIETSLAAPGR